MRLLNTETFELKSFFGTDLPPYAILSHTWGSNDDEIVYEDIVKDQRSMWEGKTSIGKLILATGEAFKLDHEWIWIDTICIDKSSSAELSEAINSMFNWYRSAEVCIVYLEDVNSEIDICNSRWFTRGWTLQELIAPRTLRFYNASGTFLGTKSDLSKLVESITGIEESCLVFHSKSSLDFREMLDSYTVAERMIWAQGRKTTRLEDQAYSLMGIFDINMPLLYGEGSKAFTRLQQEIIKVTNDHSIMAHRGSLFADGPDQFISVRRPFAQPSTTAITVDSTGIRMDLQLCPCSGDNWKGTLGILDCVLPHDFISRPALLLDGTSSFRRHIGIIWVVQPYQNEIAIVYLDGLSSQSLSPATYLQDHDLSTTKHLSIKIDLKSSCRQNVLLLNQNSGLHSILSNSSIISKITMPRYSYYAQVKSSSVPIKDGFMISSPSTRLMIPPHAKHGLKLVDFQTEVLGAVWLEWKGRNRILLLWGLAENTGKAWCKLYNEDEFAIVGMRFLELVFYDDTTSTKQRTAFREFNSADLSRSESEIRVINWRVIRANVGATDFLGTRIWEVVVSERSDYSR